MCGICGVWSPAYRPDPARLRAMNRALTRRGPDGEGYHDGARVGLAMRRLAIIDLEGGWQPVYNEDRSVVVVFNGEIYNYRELTAALTALGHSFATHSDTEVLVHLYEQYGDAFVSRLEGMFAFALWDERRSRLLIARDRLGIKPLYYEYRDGVLAFGSELKVLRAFGGAEREVDRAAVTEFLHYGFIPAPRSIYTSVRKLPPASLMAVEGHGEPRIQRYWSLDGVTPVDRPVEELRERTETLLREAVRSHLVADVPVGAFLSGGVDSGLIVAMMATLREQPVTTFTVGFTQSGPGFLDERQYARALAKRYRLDHHEIEVTPDFEAIVDEIVEAFDEPFADDSVVPSYYVSKVTGEKLKVAMTGLGGDELFAGYRRHLGVAIGQGFARIPQVLRSGVLGPLMRAIPERFARSDAVDHAKRFVRADGDAAARYEQYFAALDATAAEQLLAPGWQPRHADLFRRAFDTQPELDDVEGALRADLAVYLPDDILTLTDRLSMWHSLELRVPYLDRRLVEFAASVPARHKVDGLTQKKLLKDVARRWLPDEMIDHRKQGFEAPMGAWLRGPLLPLFDRVVTPDAIARLGCVQWPAVMRLRAEHVSGAAKNSRVLFNLLMLCQWTRRFA